MAPAMHDDGGGTGRAGPDGAGLTRTTLGHLLGSRDESDDLLAPMRLNLGCPAPTSEPSGPNAVARLSQGIRPSTALRPFAGPRACGGTHLFLRYIRVRPRHGASHVRSHSVWLSTQHLLPNCRARPDAEGGAVHLPRPRIGNEHTEPYRAAPVRAGADPARRRFYGV